MAEDIELNPVEANTLRVFPKCNRGLPASESVGELVINSDSCIPLGLLCTVVLIILTPALLRGPQQCF